MAPRWLAQDPAVASDWRYTARPNAITWELAREKGRHRRFEEARALKRNSDLDITAIFEPGRG